MEKINIEADAEELKRKGKSELRQVADLANKVLLAEEKIADLEDALDQWKKTLLKLTTEQLPELMQSFGLSEFSLATGEQVKVRDFINGSIPSESALEKAKNPEEKAALRDRMERCFAFLNANNGGAIIKSNLRAELGKGAEKLGVAALAFLHGLGVEANITRGVHPQTLNAWIRERLAKGLAVDMETFRVHVGRIAEIKKHK
jgi:hypothetical protein